MTSDKHIGSIYSVSPSKVIGVLDDDLESLTKQVDGKTYRIGQIGSYVALPEGEHMIIGMVTQVRMTESFDPALREQAVQLARKKRVIEIQLVGAVKHGRFEKGVSLFPVVGGPVYLTDTDDLSKIFATFRSNNFSIGNISLFEEERQYLDPNRFFGKHIAIMGSTGSGKSSTVASILQKAAKFPNTHIIVLDLHNEYEGAFKEEGNIIDITDLELPYWLMNFEELEEMFIDPNELTAHTQIMILKDLVLASKQNKNAVLRETLTIDTPLTFDLNEVRARIQYLDSERVQGARVGETREGPFYGQFTRFLVRMDGKINDKRYEFIFKPETFKTSESIVQLMTRILGLDTGRNITVLDLSGVPFDVVNVLVSLLGRIIFDFNFWNNHRRDFPILIVFEEAHNYLPAAETGGSSAAKKTVERIAKEGRKYGVSCMIVSQRPSEVSETILSQCNNFINLRITNPNDQNYIRKLVPDSMAGLLDILPSLRQGECLVLGDSAAIPIRTMIDYPDPPPDSFDIKFYDKWQKSEQPTNVEEVVQRWWKQERD